MYESEKLMSLFEGMAEAHGTYEIDKEDGAKKKKGQGYTARSPVTEELWKRHIKGEYSLGIIPITRDNVCYWGAIDIDEYELDLKSFAKAFYKKGLPLIVLRSKSGGAHLAVFLNEPVEAIKVQSKLSEIASSLGYSRSEIFPKQSTILIERGDLGNWLNMPYFGGNNSTRYALGKDGKAMSLTSFILIAESARISGKELDEIEIKMSTALNDGPPCLQILIGQGFPSGTRNNGLFNLGVYARNAFPDNWDKKVEEYNSQYMDPPLPSNEITAIVKQLNKKDYNYKCSDQPICNFCNIALCRTRQFGIGGSSVPTLSGMAKLPTDQPVWFLDVNGTRLELNTEQLQNQNLFQRVCMNNLNLMPRKISDKQWVSLIQTLMNTCDILEKPKDSGIAEQFSELVIKFCSDSHMVSEDKDQLLVDKAWQGPDPEGASSLRTFFKLSALEDFLIRNNFKYYTRTQMVSRLQDINFEGKAFFFNIKGRGVNVWHIKTQEQQTEPFDLPDMKENIL